MNNLNSLQNTIKDLKEIIQQSQGAHGETTVLVSQMEQLVAEMERKSSRTSKKNNNETLVPPVVHTVPVV